MRSLMLVSQFVSISLLSLLVNHAAQAQSITSDGSLNTAIVTPDNQNFVITSGRAVGSSLFHSFGNFSVPTGGSATFNTVGTPGISTIFGRVTGGNLSSIDGRIVAPANLFLINPNGVVFGANAQLLVSGSFVGTTASSIRFADGVEFAATNATPPLLTISAPVGLQFGQNAGAIRVQGGGHNLSSQNPILAPYLPTGLSLAGLRVQPGRTIALVGGDVLFNGGIVAAPGGRVEIGSVGAGEVGISRTPQGFVLDYSGVSALKNIQMSQRSLVDVGWLLDASRSSGSMQVQGNNIRLSEGSVLLSQNRGTLPGGELTVRATGLLELLGTNPSETIMSGILSETSGLGAGGNLNVSATGLIIQNGGLIQNRSFSPALGGNVTVNAAEFIQMSGLSPKTNVFNVIATASSFTTGASAPPMTTGRSGNVSVSARRLSMQDGSYIASTAFGDALAGNVMVNADAVALEGSVGRTPVGSVATGIISVGYRRGNSGAIALNTRTLHLKNGGTISTTHLGSGNAGSVTINASESIQLTSQPLLDGGLSNISSTLGTSDPVDGGRQLLDRSRAVMGNAGDITINTPSLEINQSGISVGNFGIGAAGIININADVVKLMNGGRINASTALGEGGNIVVQAQTLLLRDSAVINTDANSTGDGGNITINARYIVGLGNSDIIANAVQGRGGNIQIMTQSILGLAFRNLLNPRSIPTNDITASSQFSTNGTVQITTPGVDPNSGLVELPVDLVDTSQQIAQGCSPNQESSFVVTGRGGIPTNPIEQVQRDRAWSDLRDLSAFRSARGDVAEVPKAAESMLVEATDWQVTNGKVELIAARSPLGSQAVTCAVGLDR